MADRRLAVAAGLAFDLLLPLDLRHISGGEVDRVEQDRREAEVLDRVGDDLAREREQQARRFDQQERRQRFLRECCGSRTGRRSSGRR